MYIFAKKNFYVFSLAVIVVACVFSSCASGEKSASRKKIPFRESWGYLSRGEESRLSGDEPFNHIGYFCASVSGNGRIVELVKRPMIILKNGRRPRVHIVVNELTNGALLHFCLAPEYGVRDRLVDELAALSNPFDGLQIDWEAVRPQDSGHFHEFLRLLRNRLPGEKVLSVAVPARTRSVKNDPYDYSAISASADRVIVMAYDEHWSTSKPGPVASLSWCRSVMEYAMITIPADRLVMGLSIYGRLWRDLPQHQSMGYGQISEMIKNKKLKREYNLDTGPYLEFEDRTRVRVFYDDSRSVTEKLAMYHANGIRGVSFWRIGHWPAEEWLSVPIRISKKSMAFGGEIVH